MAKGKKGRWFVCHGCEETLRAAEVARVSDGGETFCDACAGAEADVLQCSTCEEWLPTSRFYRRSRIRRGYSYGCKDCMRAQAREKYSKTYVRPAPQELPESWQDAVCSECGAQFRVWDYERTGPHVTYFCDPCLQIRATKARVGLL